MYGFYNDETRRAGCLKTAEAHRNAAQLFPAIRKTLEQFDGKVFNCRLEKALQEATGCRVYAKKSKYSIDIYTYISDYRGNSWYTLARLKNEDLKDGKRIPAAAFISSAREYREKHLQEAAELEAAPDTVPEMAEHIRYFIAQANKLVDSIPYVIRDMYGLSIVRMY